MENAKLDEILTQAQQAERKEQWAEAHRLYQAAVPLAPDNDDAQSGMRRVGEKLIDILNQASQAAHEGKWAQAQRLYRQAIEIAPGNATAQAGLNRVDHLQQIDPQIQQLIEQGHEHFEAGRYKAAYEAYVDALNLGGEHGILRYHQPLDLRRNQARDLAAWQERVKETLATVEQIKGRQEWSKALQFIDALFQEMPTGSGYDQVAAPLQQEQQTIEDMVGDDQLYREAGDAYKARDYDLFIRRASRISPNSPHYDSIQRSLEQVEGYVNDHIRPALRLAEEACAKEEWANAFAHLDKLREKEEIDQSPVWHPHWMRAGLGQGQQALDNGRQANSQARFDQARRHFEEARQAFQKVLDVYPSNTDAHLLRDEAAELVGIATSEKQAQDLWHQEKKREQAQAALAQVQERIERARKEGRDYPIVAAVVDTMHRTISDEIERIKKERIRLLDGERLLTEKQLSEAADCFRQTLDALLPEDQRQAANGLGRVEAEMRAFKAEMERVPAAADPFQAVTTYLAAHKRWPTGPGILQALEVALVRAGQAAREAGRDAEALKYLDQVLDKERGLNPDNKTAQQERILIKEGPRIEVALDKIVDEMDGLKRREDVSAADVHALKQKLEELSQEASSHPELKKRVAGPLARAVELLKLWKAFERQYGRADKAQAEGRWAEAVELLGKGLAELEGEAPLVQISKLGAWRTVVEAIQDAEKTSQESLQEAQSGYEQSPENKDFDTPLQAVERADKTFDRLTKAVADAQGPWPKELTPLREQVSDLRRRIERTRDAWHATTATDGRLLIQQALETWSGDPTLQAFEQALTKRAEKEVKQMLQLAEEARGRGDWETAIERMRQASQIRPDDAAIRDQYAALQRQRRLEEKIREAEFDASARGGSVSEARETLQKALEALLDPDLGLPQEVRSLLEALLRLASQEAGLAFGLRELWPQAREILDQLGKMGVQSREVLQASRLAEQWAQVTRDHSLPGVVSSRIALGQALIAYRAAQDYLSGRASDEMANQQLQAATEALFNQVSESMDKRLKRARNARDNGYFPAALDNLEKLNEFYDEVDNEFPNLLSGYEQIEQMHQEAEALRHEIQRLEREATEVLPILEAAEQALQKNRLDDAEKGLKALPHLETRTDLARRAQVLRDGIAAARQELAAQRLRTAILLARSALQQATTIKDLKEIQKSLDDLAKEKEIDILKLPYEEREAYDLIVAQVNQEIKTLNAAEAREKQADDYIQQGNYQGAADELKAAIDATRDETKEAALQNKLSKIKPLAERERQREESRTRGQNYFRKKDKERNYYREAWQELSEAVRLGDDSAEVKDLIRTCRAALMVESAQNLMAEQEEEPDPAKKLVKLRDAQLEMEHAPALIEDNPEAEEIADKLDTLGKRIRYRKEEIEKEISRLEEKARLEAEKAERRRLAQEEKEEKERQKREEKEVKEKEAREAAEKALQAFILEARLALDKGELDAAQLAIQKALELSPDHEPAQQLYAEITSAALAEEKIGEAQAAMDKGNYDEALAKVQAVLKLQSHSPNDRYGLTAEDLLAQIEGGREVNEILMQAENQARAKEFQQARQTLTRAIDLGASGDRFDQVQRTLEELETEWEDKIIVPIETCMRKHEHQDAYTLCCQALNQVASPDLRKRLENLRAGAVTKWVEKDLTALRLNLYQDPPPERSALEMIVAHLNQLAALEPVENQRKEIDELSKKAHAHRLELMLDEAKQHAARRAWDKAFEQLDFIRTEIKRLKDAYNLDMGRMDKQAMDLYIALETERHEQELGQRRQQHEQLLAEVQRIWEDAGKRSDLQQVTKLASQALGIPGFEQDREALAWQRRAEEAIKAFDSTESALQKSRDRIRNRKFTEAENVLGLTSISHLFQKEHERQVRLTRILQQADADQIGGNWESALGSYQQALEMEGNLSSLLKEDQDFCRRQIMDQVLLRVQKFLEAVPPRPDEARESLERAKEKGWIVATLQGKVDRLLDWCQSQEHVAYAVEVLKQEGQDLVEALEALQEARRKLPAGQSEAAIRHWEALVEAQLAWPLDLDGVQARLQELEATPLNELDPVQRLRRDLAQKRQEEAIQQAEKQRREHLLTEARRQVGEALAASPPRCEEAVAAARRAVQQLGDEPSVAKLGRTVRARLEELLSSARSDENYTEAIRQARLLRELAPEEEAWRSLAEELAAEHRQRLEQTLQDSRDAIQAYDLDSARRNLQLADRLDRGVHEPALNSIRLELERRQSLMEQVDRLLEEVRRAAHHGQWSEAERRLREARRLAPDYAAVAEAIQTVQGQLLTASSAALEVEQFSRALELGSLGLGLGQHAKLATLQKTTIARRDAQKETLRERAQKALDIWDLPVAFEALEKAETLAPDDGAFRYLRDQARNMETQGDELARQMKAGWAALHSRDYTEAQRVFGQALKAVPSFREASSWRDYTASLEQSVRLCRNGQWEAFSEVSRLLQEAEARVCIAPGEKLPVLLPNLAEERKQAVWNIRQLQPLADQLADLYKQYESHYERVEIALAQGLMSHIAEQCQAFLRRHDAPSAPPVGFGAECGSAGAGADSTRTETRPQAERIGSRLQPSAGPSWQEAKSPIPAGDVEPPSIESQDQAPPPKSEVGEQVVDDSQEEMEDTSAADEPLPKQPIEDQGVADKNKPIARLEDYPTPPWPADESTPTLPVQDEPEPDLKSEAGDEQAEEEEEDYQNWDIDWVAGDSLPTYEEE